MTVWVTGHILFYQKEQIKDWESLNGWSNNGMASNQQEYEELIFFCRTVDVKQQKYPLEGLKGACPFILIRHELSGELSFPLLQ